MKTYKLTPLDTLFFRDGRPFNLGETGQMEVEGSFPPSPTTVVGAMRAALAKGNGWNGRNGWSDDIRAVLGDGENLGNLRFRGPYLLHDGKPLFPAPLHLLGKQVEGDSAQKKWLIARLRLGDTLATDIGEVRLPKADKVFDAKGEEVKGLKELNCWLTSAGMEQVLDGKTPESSQIVPQDCLWHTETRVGIKRDPASRTTKEDSLYNISHVRLKQGVSLAVNIEGLAEDWSPQSPALLGGESRMVWVEGIEPLELPKAPELREKGGRIRYTVTLITSADLTGEDGKTPHGNLPGLPGDIISACIGKPIMIGGWDTEAHKPKALEPHLPSGSTWFMEASENDRQKILDMHGGHIGENPDWGYGQILIGTWRDE